MAWRCFLSRTKMLCLYQERSIIKEDQYVCIHGTDYCYTGVPWPGRAGCASFPNLAWGLALGSGCDAALDCQRTFYYQERRSHQDGTAANPLSTPDRAGH